MQFGGTPRDTTDATGALWQIRSPAEHVPVEIPAPDVEAWVQQSVAADPSVLDQVKLRRRYDSEWLGVGDALARIVRERYEVSGARIATALVAAILPAALRMAFGGTLSEALALVFAILAGAGLIVAWRGARSLVRLVVLELVAVFLVATPVMGLAAALVLTLYLPPVILALAGFTGAALGRTASRIALRRQLHVAAHRGTDTVPAVDTRRSPARRPAAA